MVREEDEEEGRGGRGGGGGRGSVSVQYHDQIELSLSRTQRAVIGAVSGGVAGGVVSAVLHPIDTVKTLMQVQGPSMIQMGTAGAAGGGVAAVPPTAASASASAAATASTAAASAAVAGSGCGSGASSSAAAALRASRAGADGIAGAVSCAKQAVRKGGVRALYRGLGAASFGSMPSSAIYFGSYECCKGTLGSFGAAALGNLVSSLVFVPKEVLKQRMQAGTAGVRVPAALRGVLREQGVRGLYTGFTASVLRNMPSNAINFWTFEKLRALQLQRKRKKKRQQARSTITLTQRYSASRSTTRRVSKDDNVALGETNAKNDMPGPGGSSGRLSILESMATGAASGTAGAIVTTPVDVVKTKIMTKPGGKQLLKRGLGVYNSLPSTLALIWRTEGARGLCRGMTPRLLYSALFGATGFMVFEQIRGRLALLALSADASRNGAVCAHVQAGDIEDATRASGRGRQSRRRQK